MFIIWETLRAGEFCQILRGKGWVLKVYSGHTYIVSVRNSDSGFIQIFGHTLLQGGDDKLLLLAGEGGPERPVNVPEGKGRLEKSNRGDAEKI